MTLPFNNYISTQARFANGLFDGWRVVGDSTPTFGASVGHAVAVVGNVEKPMGATVAEGVTLERFVLREAAAKEVVIGLIHGAFLLLAYSF